MPVKNGFNQTIIALIPVDKLLISQLKWVIDMSKNIFCLIKTCAPIHKSPHTAVNFSFFLPAVNARC